MTISFITGNKNKLAEVQRILGDVEALDIDLDEIQSLDAHEVIKHKLKEAFEHHQGPFIVEDTSLYIKELNGLPGPLIKWFLKTVGNDGLAKIANTVSDTTTEVRTIIGYAQDPDNIHFFEGVTQGKIVEPRGETGFGWDPIFMPDGYDTTFAEMTNEEKDKFSMRKVALEKLREHLSQ